jgi:hypothetical protein
MNNRDEGNNFWKWFATYATRIGFPPSELHLDAIGEHLGRVHPALAFQIGKLDDALVLEISTDGHRELMPIVRELCAAAPTIPGWSVCAFKQPCPAATIHIGEHVLGASELSFVLDDVVDGRAILGVFVEGLAEEPELAHAVFVLVQGILGELVVLTKIHEFVFGDASERPDDAYPVSMLADFLENIGDDTEAEVADEPRDWIVADVELRSGKNLVVSLRTRVPADVTPAIFEHRVSVRCLYPDRGDGSGLPTSEQLQTLKQFERELGSVGVHLMSKTGDGARESVFQVANVNDFRALAGKRATELGIQCGYNTATDPTWHLWTQTVTQFATPSN